MFSRTTTRSHRSGVRFLIGVGAPGYSLTGRKFTYWSKSNRSFSSNPRSTTPGGTSGVPIAPSKMASWLPNSACTDSGSTSPVRR